MTMKELIEDRANERKQKCLQHHKVMVAIHGNCKPFTVKEYNQVATKQKASFTKGKGFAFKGLWNHKNINLKTV